VTFLKSIRGFTLIRPAATISLEGEGNNRKVGRAVPSAPGSSRTAGDSRPYPRLGQAGRGEGEREQFWSVRRTVKVLAY